MGRIKTTQIKRITREIMQAHGAEFTKDFDQNKKVVDGMLDGGSKKMRNVIAGYATRLSQKKEYARMPETVQ
jgi:small subunit ribosomal protein S17e